MQAAGCECEHLAAEQSVRVDKWRILCQQFYFEQDAAAKCVLDFFESSKLDQIIIDTKPEAESAEERAFTQLVAFLGLHKCTQSSEHAHFFDQTIEVFEHAKNEVRGSYHRHRAHLQYQEFDAHVNQTQGTNYEVKRDNSERLVLRVQEDYLRSVSNQTHMEASTKAFIKAHLSNVGAHPFLAGLAQVLRWNLESTTVVGWQLSDAVFVESGGPAFAGAALNLLVGTLNFGHFELPQEPELRSASSTTGINNSEITAHQVKSRAWLLDPYMSDHDIRQVLQLFPTASSKKLEARPTGSKFSSEIYRMNIHGKHDEHQHFFERWCVML